MRRSYSSFFGAFGGINKIQGQSIPLIYSGKNVIIHSPSASGKTEAASAPLTEKILASNDNNLLLLYISPTKALVNDIYRRLQPTLSKLNVGITYKTMDKPTISEGRGVQFLITTPESFDSLLSRHPNIFLGLKYIILDELHLVDGGIRGDQLRILLDRVRLLTREKLQYVALSATLFNPKKVAERYFDDVAVIESERIKGLKMNLVQNIDEAIEFLKSKKLHKALFFANSRKEVEEGASYLKKIWPKDRVLVHHSSLSKMERQTSEKCMQAWRWGICVATTTLEIGVDIGDIDVVGFISPPLSSSSFYQRAGRGCRKKDEIQIVAIYKDELEKNIFLTYYNEYFASSVEEPKYEIDNSLIVQQIFSILYGKRDGILRAELNQLLSKYFNFEIVNRVITHLIDGEHIIKIGNKLFPSEWLLDFGASGRIHANIESERDYKLFNNKTGSFIGSIKLKPNESENFVFSGRVWKIVKITMSKIFVEEGTSGISKNLFAKSTSRGFFSKFLPEGVRGGGNHQS